MTVEEHAIQQLKKANAGITSLLTEHSGRRDADNSKYRKDWLRAIRDNVSVLSFYLPDDMKGLEFFTMAERTMNLLNRYHAGSDRGEDGYVRVKREHVTEGNILLRYFVKQTLN